MNAKEAKKLTTASKLEKTTEIPFSVEQDIKRAALAGENSVCIDTGNLDFLKSCLAPLRHNGYGASVTEKTGTQGDYRSWGYIHTLDIWWK